MSKVNAYICDACGNLKPDDEIVGILPVEDLLDKLLSYPTIMQPIRCEIHYCFDCYREKVLVPSSNQADRRKEEELYKVKLKELGFALRQTCVTRWIAAKRKTK